MTKSWLVFVAPFVIGGSALALAAFADPPTAAAGVDRLVIPAGTAARVQAGLPISEVLPETIDTTVGRALVVLNADRVNHVFGPIILAPGQRWEKRFGAPGEIRMLCSVYPDTGFRIRVAMPGGLVGGRVAVMWGAAATWFLLAALALFFATRARSGDRLDARRPVARQRLRTILLALPGVSVVAVLAGLGALAGLAGWGAVMGSQAMVLAWTFLVGSGLGVFLGWSIAVGDANVA